MKRKVYQTDTSEKGDCHKCAISSLFGWDMEEMPNFVEYGLNWRLKYIEYMDQKGFKILFVPITSPETLDLFLRINPYMSGYCLLSVKSFQHEKVAHCVVGLVKNGQLRIVHDPNKEINPNSFVYEVFTIDVFIPKTKKTGDQKDKRQ